VIEVLVVVSIIQTAPLGNFFNNIAYCSFFHL
jgi:hypothetical protein